MRVSDGYRSLDHLEYLSLDAEALAAAAEAALDRRVPGCPEWTVPDLVEHVGQIHRWVAAMVSTKATSRLDRERQPSAPKLERQLMAWYREGAGALLEVLKAAGEGTPVWNWSSEPQVSAFWDRRMAHETAIHRWDAQSASRTPTDIVPELAVDGIDELVTVFVPRYSKGSPDPADLGGTLGIACDDVPGEWLVRLAGTESTATRGSADGDAVVHGRASDVLLFLYNRVAVSRVAVRGDESIVQRWTTHVRW